MLAGTLLFQQPAMPKRLPVLLRPLEGPEDVVTHAMVIGPGINEALRSGNERDFAAHRCVLGPQFPRLAAVHDHADPWLPDYQALHSRVPPSDVPMASLKSTPTSSLPHRRRQHVARQRAFGFKQSVEIGVERSVAERRMHGHRHMDRHRL